MAHSRSTRDSGRVRPKNNPYKRERFNEKSWINQSTRIINQQIVQNAKTDNDSKLNEQLYEQAYLDIEDQYIDLYDIDSSKEKK